MPTINPSQTGTTDSAIALTYLNLAAESLGLGMVWLGFVMGAATNWEPLRQFLAIPENREICGIVALGYSAYEYQRIPLRKEARVTWR